MKRILFVDDESAMLLLFEMGLKHMEADWELFFAKNGEDALALMERKPIDVVISDMIMPKMDGARFLNEVMRRFPQTIRFILSGHLGAEDVAKCVNAVHQYLRKPCDFATLKTILIRVCSLDVFLENKELQKLVASMTVVPSLPSLYFRMMHELGSPNSPVEQIAALVEQDPGMAAKLLQLANSAFLGIQRKISTPAEAVQFLGVKTVRSLALYFHAFACFEQAMMAEFSFGQHWSHCFRTASTPKCSRIWRRETVLWRTRRLSPGCCTMSAR